MMKSTGDAINDPASNVAAGIGLDQLFRYAASQRPDALALVDPPDREQVIGGAPRALTYAQADRAISSARFMSSHLNGPKPFCGSRPSTTLRVTDKSSHTARS